MKMAETSPDPDESKQVFLVDDHPLFREGLVKREPDLAICGEADNAPQALSAIERLKPELVLADIGLPGKSGVGTATPSPDSST
jgi:DNA-binding NarL/FixJ family response regulator